MANAFRCGPSAKRRWRTTQPKTERAPAVHKTRRVFLPQTPPKAEGFALRKCRLIAAMRPAPLHDPDQAIRSNSLTFSGQARRLETRSFERSRARSLRSRRTGTMAGRCRETKTQTRSNRNCLACFGHITRDGSGYGGPLKSAIPTGLSLTLGALGRDRTSPSAGSLLSEA